MRPVSAVVCVELVSLNIKTVDLTVNTCIHAEPVGTSGIYNQSQLEGKDTKTATRDREGRI